MYFPDRGGGRTHPTHLVCLRHWGDQLKPERQQRNNVNVDYETSINQPHAKHEHITMRRQQ